MKKPKAILFDFGDTILHENKFEPENGNQFLYSIIDDKKGIKYEQILDRIKKLNAEIYPQKNEKHFEVSWIAFNRLIFDYFNLSIPISHEEGEFEFWKRSYEWEPAPNIQKTLEALKQMEIKIGIVSNIAFSGKTLEYELKKHDLLNYFDFVIASSDYGFRKPHPFIFNLAISRLNTFPNETWFIGDNIECDINGSKKVGMKALQYIGKNREIILPDNKVLQNWDELIKFLMKIEK